MKKFKINANVLALLMLIALFAGWEYMILVTVFIWCFCESSQNLKNLTISALAIYAGCHVFSLLWNIAEGWCLFGTDALEGLFEVLIGWEIDVLEASLNLTKYVIIPIKYAISVIDSLVALLILLTKFRFVVSIITNRPMTGAFSKIQEYINYFINFANSNLYEDQPMNNMNGQMNNGMNGQM
ncbi:MAG: hypothetical protein IJN90_02615 [Bacilli bacterium]|nr:hypothetical protein [Bacilli bacterium]